MSLIAFADSRLIRDLRSHAGLWTIASLFAFIDNGWSLLQEEVWFHQRIGVLWQCSIQDHSPNCNVEDKRD